jgi:hypothetical protein
MQLSAKSLLKPFMSAIKDSETRGSCGEGEGDDDDGDVAMPPLENIDEDVADDDDGGENGEAGLEGDDDNESIDELERLDDEDRRCLISETANVRATLSKVSMSFTQV